MPVTSTTLVTTVSNDFVRQLPGVHAPRGTNAKIRTRDRRLRVVWILIEPVDEKHFYWHNPSHSAWPWWWRANTFEKQRVSLRGVCVRDVISTVTKHTDYFVWKETSECVTRRCDDCSWQEMSEIFMYWNVSFWEGVQQHNNRQNPLKCFLQRATNVKFSNFCGWRQKKKTIGFLKLRFARFELIHDSFILLLLLSKK